MDTDDRLDALMRAVRDAVLEGGPYVPSLRALLADVVEKADAFDLMETLYVGGDFAWGDPPRNVLVFENPCNAPISADLQATLLDAVRAYRKAREG
jgi:hypothetical protein